MNNSNVRPAAQRPSSALKLSAHGFEVELAPAFGGRIDAARHEGQDIFVPRRHLSDPNPLDAGCFPLVPFSNRIRQGHFSWQGQPHTLATNWHGDGHVIHGEGWHLPWQVISHDNDHAVLKCEGTDWWPWAYECLQSVHLRAETLELSLSLKNTGTTPMPAGLGFHPYFPRYHSTRLGFSAKAVWPPMGKEPLHPAAISGPKDFSTQRGLENLSLDHCYEGWTGPARIVQPDQGRVLTIETSQQATTAVLFVPKEADFFCFEPVTHLTGAFEIEDTERSRLAVLDPGAHLDFTMHLSVTPLH